MASTASVHDKKTIVITGSTGGLGLEAARQSALLGHHVIVTGRHAERGRKVVSGLKAQTHNDEIVFYPLDLTNLDQVRSFDKTLGLEKIDVLINNAGVMAPPKRILTPYGQELQFGTNHLAHFLLTSTLLPALTRGRGKVITVSSLAARKGKIHFDDLRAERYYDAFERYRQSKLANLMFALSLDARLKAHDIPVQSCAAHPGWTRTNIISNIAQHQVSQNFFKTLRQRLFLPVGRMLFNLAAQDASEGVKPLLLPAWSTSPVSGHYYGPQGKGERTGDAGPALIPTQALDQNAQAHLWQVSADITGAYYPFPIS